MNHNELIRKIYEFHQKGKNPRGEGCPVCSGAYAHADGCYYPDLQDAMIGILGEKGAEAERLRDVMQRLVRSVGDRERALRDALNDHASLDIQLFEARAAMRGSDEDDEDLDDPTGYCF